MFIVIREGVFIIVGEGTFNVIGKCLNYFNKRRDL